jgi:hypothetical protein
MRLAHCLLFLAALAPALAMASDPLSTLVVNSSPPAISFEVRVNGEGGKIEMPAIIPGWKLQRAIDPDGILAVRLPAGSLAYHVGIIASQLSGVPAYELDLDKAAAENPTLSSEQTAALQWLERHMVELEGGAVTWHNTFDHPFYNLIIRAPWQSAFAQADIIKGLMIAARVTRDRRHIETARRAAYAYGVACGRGGLRCRVGGVPWYEEIPIPHGFAPMILNGHLYSTLMLGRLARETGDERVDELFRAGIEAAKSQIPYYDTGYWTVYQRRPRMLNAYFLLRPNGETVLYEASLKSPWSLPAQGSFLETSGEDPQVAIGRPGWTRTENGAALSGPGFLSIRPNRLAIDNNPIAFPGFTLTLIYSAPDCHPPTVATYDWRAGLNGYMALLPRETAPAGTRCRVTFHLTTTELQWSQTNRFYHDWHTRLAKELSALTGDPFFDKTARRWQGYLAEYDRLSTKRNADPLEIRFPTRP